MKKGICLLLALAMVLGLCSTTAAEEELSLGTWDGNTYENAFLGISLDLDQDWYVLSEEERARQLGLVFDSVAGTDLEEVMTDALEKGQDVLDLNAIRQDGSGDNITILISNMSVAMGAMGMFVDEKTVCQSGREALESYFTMQGCEIIGVTEDEIQFCGKSHYSMLIEASYGGQYFCEVQIYLKMVHYMGVVNIFSKSKTRLEEMKNLFRPYTIHIFMPQA